jgi:hypothetical protein
MKAPEKLINDHWAYVANLIDLISKDFDFATAEWIYKTAMEHGYKHGYEDAKNETGPPRSE